MLSYVLNWRGTLWIISDDLRTYAGRFAPYVLNPARQICFAVGATTTALRLTMLEHRLTPNDGLTKEIRARLPEILSRSAALLRPPTNKRDAYKRRALVLRAPVMGETSIKKGVLLLKFTETFRFIYNYTDTEKLLRYFRIVLEPSWSGYCLPEILFWARHDQPIIVQASEPSDRKFLQELGSCLVPISIGASDWVDHRVFRPLGLAKEYDVIYVANLSSIKRVHIYLRALKILVSRRGSVRAALVLSRWGGNRSTLEQLLNLYNLNGKITLFMNISQQKLNETLNRSKVSVLLSKKEGSNKSLFESMFSDVPVLLLRDNIGVNKDYINKHTGLLVSEEELPNAIEHVAEMSPPLSPRSWAMNNIAPEITSRKLQSVLDALNSEDGGSTTPLWVKVNSPEAKYMDPTVSQLVPNSAELLDCFAKQTASGESEAALDARIRTLFHHS